MGKCPQTKVYKALTVLTLKLNLLQEEPRILTAISSLYWFSHTALCLWYLMVEFALATRYAPHPSPCPINVSACENKQLYN